MQAWRPGGSIIAPYPFVVIEPPPGLTKSQSQAGQKISQKSRLMDRCKVSAVKQLVIRISLIATDAEQLHSGNSRVLPAGGALCAAS
jgi:hypothetical protein